MVQTVGRVLKADDVEIEGRFQLDLGHTGGARNTQPAVAKAKILENQGEYAVIEVTCVCGRKTTVRCEYAEPVSAKNTQARAEPAVAAGRAPEKKT